MTQTAGASKPKAIDAKILDEDIERARRQIGISQYSHDQAFNRQVSEDVIRHFAFGMVGDDNPLWHEPDYARTTRWRGLIAPPLFASTTGINETPKYSTPELKALFKGLYKGVGRYNVGTQWKLFKPIRPGDQFYHDMCVDEVKVKDHSSFSGSRTVIDRIRHLYVNKDGEPTVLRYETFVNAERGGSKNTNKHGHAQRHVYSSAEIDEIDRLYAAEVRRGAEPRWWEDVNVGDELVPVAKGPLSTMDIICANLGWGVSNIGGYGGGPLRYGWKTRLKMSNFYVEDKYGVPGSMLRVHWDPDLAADLGLPAPYDYAQMRSNWAAHLVTNWMGDDAWMSSFHTEIRAFNLLGDTTILSGRVIDKRTEGHNHLVTLEVEGTNQRNEVNVSAQVAVLLPSRSGGPVILPRPEAELCARGAQLMSDAARRIRAGE